MTLLHFIKIIIGCLKGASESPKTVSVGVVANEKLSMFRLPNADKGLRQSEILSNVVERRVNLDALREGKAQVEVDRRTHPFAIIITQDCDLDWDFTNRSSLEKQSSEGHQHKLIPTILLREVATATTLRGRSGINSGLWKNIKQNKDDRYHFISEITPDYDLHREGLPELGIDFKRYFTIPTTELYWQIESGECKRRVWLNNPYLEHLSHRFANYLSRIALPHEYESQ